METVCFKNKTVLITGGSQGIGEAVAKRFIREGARVIVFDLKKPKYEVSFYKTDIKNEKDIKKAFLNINKLDILVNNAGVYLQSSVEKTSKEQLDEVIDTNLKGTYMMCKYALPLITKQKGNVINISSGLGIAPEPESPAYCSSKAGIIMLTKCLAQEYASKGVRVNVILPGPINTPMLKKALKSTKEMKTYKNKNPLKRLGESREVAGLVLFLASKEASYMTGGSYSIDGGESSSSLYSK